MSTPLLAMFGFPGHLELLIVGFVILLLFGNRLPTMMKSVGQSFGAFKKGLHDDAPEELPHSDTSNS